MFRKAEGREVSPSVTDDQRQKGIMISSGNSEGYAKKEGAAMLDRMHCSGQKPK